MSWESHRKHQRSRPSRQGLEAMVGVVRPGARVLRVRRLVGGLSTATHRVEVQDGAGRLALVLKRFAKGDATLELEWERLRFVHGTRAVPSPEPLACDPEGAWFGTPALAMGVLPGRAWVTPVETHPFVAEIARTLALLHAAPIAGAPASMRRRRRRPWALPEKLRRTALVERAAAAVGDGPPPARERVLLHGDFHPGNLLWSRGRVSGIVDWSNARIGPRAAEVAYCRADLAVLLGGDAADAFLDAYGEELPDLRAWDLVCGLGAMRWGRLWPISYNEQGASLTPALALRRAGAWVRRCLDRT